MANQMTVDSPPGASGFIGGGKERRVP